jgi:tetratricopeptide (TPR) repeat protein
MRYLNALLTVLFACSSVLAQESVGQKLHQALILDQQGRFDAVIMIARSVTDAAPAGVNDIELGRAYLLLGLAYEQTGNVNESERAYERSLRLLEPHREAVDDYASGLENFAGLYIETGRLEAAGKMWLSSLQLRQQIGDHAGVVRSLLDLTGFDLSQQRIREARKYFKRAEQEVKSVRDLTDDDFALFFETKGWLAMSEGNTSAAVADYRHALEITRRSRGEHHWITGWEAMLLGKAYAGNGDLNEAMDQMRQGLTILEQALGPNSSKSVIAKIAYSQLLDRAGLHSEAANLKAAAESATRQMYAGQCVGCTINVAGFR